MGNDITDTKKTKKRRKANIIVMALLLFTPITHSKEGSTSEV